MWLLSVGLLGCLAAYLCGSNLLSLPPYMDEIFHIPQAQVICQQDFQTWDPKITTFPGLYYLSYLIQEALNVVLGSESGAIPYCSAQSLRILNIILSIGIFALAYLIRNQIRSTVSKPVKTSSSSYFQDSIFLAWIIYLYPFSFLYYTLYYTDTASLFFYLLTHTYVYRVYFSKPRDKNSGFKVTVSLLQHLTLFVFASLCIFMRQTNVIWILFLVGITMLQVVSQDKTFADSTTWSLNSLLSFIIALWNRKFVLLMHMWSLLLPIIGFVGFVYWNKGIVLGDKENHQPAIHVAMLTHGLVLYTILASPRILLDIHYSIVEEKKERGSYPAAAIKLTQRQLFSSPWKALFCMLVVIGAGLSLVYGSLSHPFLLADNRHYIFYIWNRILKHFRYRLILSPVYSLLVLVGILDLSKKNGMIWMVIFILAAALSLLPTPLLEPRYFTQAVVTAMLHSAPVEAERKGVAALYFAQVLLLIAFNAVVFYVYYFKPFTWHDGSVARFLY